VIDFRLGRKPVFGGVARCEAAPLGNVECRDFNIVALALAPLRGVLAFGAARSTGAFAGDAFAGFAGALLAVFAAVFAAGFSAAGFVVAFLAVTMVSSSLITEEVFSLARVTGC
jgi:hypothetical protein